METALKILHEDEKQVIAGGYGVVYGGRDVVGETFTPETDYMLDLVPRKLAFIDHSLGSEIEVEGKAYQLKGIDDPVGEVVSVEPDDTGLYMQLMFDKASQYWGLVEQMIDSGKAGLSTGSVSHFVRKSGDGTIRRWPIVETSITLTPAEPRTIGVERLKALVKDNPGLKALFAEAARTADEQATDGEHPEPQTVNITIINQEESKMSDEQKTAAPALDMDALAERIGGAVSAAMDEQTKGFSEGLDAILERLSENGQLKDAGYVAPDSETDHPEAKSFGDFLLAVKNGNHKRLRQVYKAQREGEQGGGRYKAAYAEGGGSTGGYLVPEEFQARLMAATEQHGVIRRNGATVLPVSAPSGRIPALYHGATSFTRGQTNYAGGVRTFWTAEAGALTETEATFNQIEYNVHKLGGYTLASNEVVADSAISIEQLITRLFGVAIAAEEDWVFLRGDGVGKPLGILNAPCLATKGTDNSNFDLPDAVAMYAAFKSFSGGGVWLMNRSLIPDFDSQITVSQGTDFVQPRENVPMSLLGYPIEFTEMLPLADNDGDALLADLSAYIIFDLGGVSIDYSEHYKFVNDQGTWRFTKRLDAMPWLESTIELNDGTTVVSPFVAHND